MKIPSLFTKTPTYQRFEYRPRYYDPQAEEIKQREEKILREMQPTTDTNTDYRSRITGSFHAARRRSANTQKRDFSAVILRFGMLLFLVLLLVAFLEYGKPALYGGLLLIPLYVYLKFKK